MSKRPVTCTDANTPIEVLKQRVHDFCEERDWAQFHNAKDLAIAISTEASELLEIFRFLSSSEVAQLFNDPDRCRAIEAELADVLIFVLRFGERFGFDLSAAVQRKLSQNAERYPVALARGSNSKALRRP